MTKLCLHFARHIALFVLYDNSTSVLSNLVPQRTAMFGYNYFSVIIIFVITLALVFTVYELWKEYRVGRSK